MSGTQFTREELKALMKETVEETFIMLGVKIDDPIEVQKDFQHLREWRLTTASIKAKAMIAAVGVVTTGALAAIWVGFKDAIHR
jgi:hypothetical protein